MILFSQLSIFYCIIGNIERSWSRFNIVEIGGVVFFELVGQLLGASFGVDAFAFGGNFVDDLLIVLPGHESFVFALG